MKTNLLLLKSSLLKASGVFKAAFLLLVLLLIGTATRAQVVYSMGEPGNTSAAIAGDLIQKMNYDGTNVSTVITGANAGLIQPYAVALDGNNNRIFVSEINLSGNVIKVITGSSVTSTITSANSAYIKDINYDVVGNWLYYITEGGDITQVTANDALYRVHPDGTGTQTLAASVTKNPYRLEVDAANNKVYVVDVSFSGRSIKTVDLANSNAVTSRAFATSLNSVYDVALDKVTGYLYYCAEGGSAATLSATDQVRRQNIDGTNDVPIAASVCNSPFRLGLDAGNNRLYVGDAYYGTGKIVAINLTDNTFSTTLNFTTGVNTPQIYDFGVPDRPTVTTAAVSSVAATSATLGGTLVYGYGLSTERGVVYSSTNSTPTVSDTKAANATVTTNGAYSASVSGLSASTTYYARAYAINGAGTTYGAVVTFSTQSNDANLSAFTISSGTLTPAFAAGTISYTASVTSATTSITVTPTRNQANATIKVNNTTVTSGSASGSLTLNIGDNVISTVVTAQDASSKTYTLTVNRPKAAQTITFASTNTKTYGDADYAPAATAGSGLTVSYASSNTAVATIVSGQIHIVGAGTTNITASQAGDASNAAATDVVQALTVNKNAITVTATAGQTKVYGNADPTFAYTVTTGTVKSGDTFSGALTRAAGTNVGSYAIAIGTLALNTTNYTLTLTSNNFSITKRNLEITPTVQTKVYGDADPASFTYNFTGGTSTANGDQMTGSFTRVAGEIPGTYALSLGTKRPIDATATIEQSGNYNITFVSVNLTITKRAITLTPANRNKTYGDDDPYLNAFSITAGSLAPGHQTSGAFARAAGENAGTYSISGIGTKFIVQGGINNVNEYYNITVAPGIFTIDKRALTVTAAAKIKNYGDTDPELNYTTDNTLGFTDAFTGALSRTAGENFGTYAINQNTLALNTTNYTLTYAGAVFTINKKIITVTATAKNKTFGDTDPALTYTADALASGDSFSGAISRAAGQTAGIYAIGQGSLALGSNYTLNFTGANFTIDKKVVTVTAAAKTKTYGDSDPALTYTADALIAGDSFTGALTRIPGETAGTYAIGQGTLTLTGNYSINYTAANLTVAKRVINVYSLSPYAEWGWTTDAPIGYWYTGTLAPGDALSGTLSREPGTEIGVYHSTQGSLKVTNSESYDLVFHTNNYTITPRGIIVSGGSTVKIYGDADPAINYTFVPGTSTFLNGNLITGSLGRDPGETAGPYNVTQNTLTINDSHYRLIFQGGYFEIDRAPLTLTIDNKTKVATKPNPALTYSVSGYKNGDTEATAFTSAIQLTTDASISSAAGDYNIYPVGSVTAINYNINQVGGTMTVTPASTINTLASVTLNGGGFNEPFDPATEFYSVSVPNGSTSAALVPTVTDPLSSITIGYGPVTPLASGATYTVNFTGGNTQQVPVNVTAEDGTVKSYYFNITPIPSDSKLSNLDSDIGIISPSFNPLVTSYFLNVSAETDSVTIIPTTHDRHATARVSGGEGGATGAKRVAIIEGINPKSIIVRSADGTSTTFYSLLIKRPIRLASLTLSAGNLFPAFDPNVTSYVAKVPSGIPAITVTPKGNKSYFQLLVNGDYVNYGDASNEVTINEDGSTTITVKIIAGDGETSQTYTINVQHASTDAKLAGITLSEGSLDPLFENGTTEYDVYLPNSTKTFSFVPVRSEPNATVKVNYAPLAAGEAVADSALQVGVRNYYIVVTAADGATNTTYKLGVHRAYSSEAGLSNILLSHGALSPVFDQTMYNTYDVILPNDVTTIDVTPVLIDSTGSISARLSGRNVALPAGVITAPLAVGINSLIITSVAQDGTTMAVTSVILKRLGDPALSNLAVSTPGTFSPAFNRDTYTYAASVDYAAANYALTPTLMDPGNIIKINGNVVTNDTETLAALQVGDNTVAIEVIAPDGDSKTYTITVTRAAPATDNYLASLTASAGRFLFAFNKDNGFNQILVPNGVSTFTVTPVTSDARATIRIAGYAVTSGMASQPLTIGTSYQMVVTAEDGTERYYTVWPKYLSTNANLSLLSTTAGVITPTFNANILSYNLTVPAGVSGTNINAYLADSTARISLNGAPKRAYGYYDYSVPLAYGINTLQLAVTPQEGADKVYTITITRTPASANANLSKIALSQQSTLTSTTGTANYNYNMVVSSTATSATLTLTAQDADAKVAIDGATGTVGSATGTVAIGTSAVTVNIEVTAADGTTKKTYKIAVVKAASANAYLDKIVLSQPSTLSTTTGTANYNYNMVVNSSATSATLSLTAQDAGAKVAINGATGTVGSATGTVAIGTSPTIVEIEVTAADGTTKKTYHIAVVKAPSANAYLDKIVLNESSVLSGTTGTANYNYNMVIKSAAGTAILTLTAQDADAKIAINGGTATVGTASTTVANSETPVVTEIEVTAADGITKKTYKITSVKAPSANANLDKMLWDQPSTLTVTTGTANYNYNSILSSSAATATLSITAQDANASISVNGAAGVLGSFNAIVPISATPVVTNIEITAADGVTKRTYRVTSTKAPSKNANLSKMAVNLTSVLSATTGPADHNYNSVVTSAETNGILKLTAQDEGASISINGAAGIPGIATAPVVVSGTPQEFSIIVIAADGITTVTYHITVSKAGPPVVAATGNNKNQINLVQKSEQPTTDTQLEELIVKQAVSPNGDGINDRFTIEGISAFPENTVRVMNRNGDVIYEAKGYDNEGKAFDGRNSKGVMQQAGTYFYSIEYKKDGASKRKTGYIIVKF